MAAYMEPLADAREYKYKGTTRHKQTIRRIDKQTKCNKNVFLCLRFHILRRIHARHFNWIFEIIIIYKCEYFSKAMRFMFAYVSCGANASCAHKHRNPRCRCRRIVLVSTKVEMDISNVLFTFRHVYE